MTITDRSGPDRTRLTADSAFPSHKGACLQRRTAAWSRRIRLAAAGGGILALLFSAGRVADAQYVAFGKNKVNYQEFDWRLLKSPHFDFYYYPEEEDLARLVLAAAERSYTHHRAAFAHDMPDPIPLILYSSHHDFEQTNVTSMLIPEGVAGLTEFMRGRVLLPFDGSYFHLHNTLQHELVHAFQLSINRRMRTERPRIRSAPIPLWFTEGLAEHWSADWDPDGDMILRDLVISGRLPEISQFWQYHGTFTMYKLGQSLLDYICETYGDDKLLQFYTDTWKVRRFEELFPIVLGISANELSSRWVHWLRERYYPDVIRGEPILHTARLVTKLGQELKPTPVPAGIPDWEGRFLFVSPRSGYANIYTASLAGGERNLRSLIKGQRSQEFLSFHSYRSRMDISPQGLLAFSAHSGDRDLLVLYDLISEEVVQSWAFERLVGITSPMWDAAGKRIVFAGLARSGQSDLFILDADTGELSAITDDWFHDSEPAFHPDGDRIVFVSDRGSFGREGAFNLHEVDLTTGLVRTLTCGAWWDLSPSWSPDGERLLFVSTRDGMRDLYVVDREGCGARVTKSLEAIKDPRWMPSGDEVLASIYHGGRLHAAVIPVAEQLSVDSLALRPSCGELWAWTDDSSLDLRAEPATYESSFALDVAQGGVAVAPGLGTNEGVHLLLRDLMGNRLILFQLARTTIATQNFLDNFSAGVTYFDISRRVNRGVSLYHYAGTYYDAADQVYFERLAGGSVFLSYPFTRFTRLETSLGLAYSDKEKPATDLYREGALATHTVSWIHDTSLWLPTGPIDGDRRHLTVGLGMNLKRPGVENVFTIADVRKYFRLGGSSALAVRIKGALSEGPDPQIYRLGGPHSLRGYSWWELYGTRLLLANLELRFPLLRGLLVVPARVGPLSLPGVQGGLFFDVGQAWEDGWADDWFGGYGFGLRMGLGGMLVLRLDFARRTDFAYWPPQRHTEFSIGWNY